MKQMKINEPKVLKAILNKTKVKDIRKAYGYCTDCGEDCDINSCGMQISQGMIDKPPKYEVGDIVEIIWTGDEILLKDGVEYGWIKHNQILAKVKIISREKIWCDGNCIWNDSENKRNYHHYNKQSWVVNNHSKQEGFKSVEEMFNWLKSYADLSTPKSFYLYGMEYMEE